MKISRSLKIMNPITLITPKKFSGLRSCKMLRSVPTHFFVYCYCVMRLFTVLSNPVGRYLPRFFKSVVSSDSIDSAKGQIKLKADWRAIDSPKKRTNEFGFFAMTVRNYLKLEISISSFKFFRTVKQKKTNRFVQFLGESSARQSVYGFI